MHVLPVHLLCQSVHTLGRSFAVDKFCTILLSSLMSLIGQVLGGVSPEGL